MRLLPVIFCVLLLCSCASGKPQYIPPVKIVAPEATAQPETVELEPATEIKPTEAVKSYDEMSFLAILLKEGMPTENIIPRSKEQIAVYKKETHVTFYYFKKNRLVQQNDYSLAEIVQMKADNSYPDKVLKDMGASE